MVWAADSSMAAHMGLGLRVRALDGCLFWGLAARVDGALLPIEYGADLLQLPCQLPCVCPGNDLSKWTIKRWWFNGQFFNSIQDMISSWNADNKGIRSSFKLLKPGADSSLQQYS